MAAQVVTVADATSPAVIARTGAVRARTARVLTGAPGGTKAAATGATKADPKADPKDAAVAANAATATSAIAARASEPTPRPQQPAPNLSVLTWMRKLKAQTQRPHAVMPGLSAIAATAGAVIDARRVVPNLPMRPGWTSPATLRPMLM